MPSNLHREITKIGLTTGLVSPSLILAVDARQSSTDLFSLPLPKYLLKGNQHWKSLSDA